MFWARRYHSRAAVHTVSRAAERRLSYLNWARERAKAVARQRLSGDRIDEFRAQAARLARGRQRQTTAPSIADGTLCQSRYSARSASTGSIALIRRAGR